MSETYATRTDAIEQYIEPALGDYASDYDVDGIFADYFEYREDEHGFVEREGADFWGVARAHDVSGK